MHVDVEKSKLGFLNLIEPLYNKEHFFIEDCTLFPGNLSLENRTLDAWLRVIFEENNKIIIQGCLYKYCDKEGKRKMRLMDIGSEVGTPDINIINNYKTDTWEKVEW